MALKKKKVTKKSAKQNVVLETNKGNITIELLNALAPNHCKRILKLSKEKLNRLFTCAFMPANLEI